MLNILSQEAPLNTEKAHPGTKTPCGGTKEWQVLSFHFVSPKGI
jgi:hypothetical protein